MKQINHTHIFLNALRTAVLFFAGFLMYEILIDLEKAWNDKDPENKALHYYNKKILKFIGVLIIDLILLYILFFITGEHF